MAGALARKYARALVEVALEKRIQQQVGADLDGFLRLFEENAEFRNVLENPAIPFRSKREIVKQLGAKAKAADEVTNFLSLLLQNNRITMLAEVQQAFVAVLNEKLGVLSGEVFTPTALPDEQKRNIESGVAGLTGKKVHLGYHEDPSLIAGVKIHLGSTIYDGTVRKQLEEIRKRIQ
ncbi:MAG TPA: ATP synthase F1 subunit delta [Acidobacteriota bacterium]|jgi:F-type H+-transporting ATPase subunit delta